MNNQLPEHPREGDLVDWYNPNTGQYTVGSTIDEVYGLERFMYITGSNFEDPVGSKRLRIPFSAVVKVYTGFKGGIYIDREDEWRAEVQKERARILIAAVRAADGEVILGIRHYGPEIRRQMKARPDGDKFCGHEPGVDQGFVDQFGHFYTRTEAYDLAVRKGQISPKSVHTGAELFSEDLY